MRASAKPEWAAWFSRWRGSWHSLFPPCDQPACTAGRHWLARLWRQPGGIRMHGAWYCSPPCFEQAAERMFSRLQASAHQARSRKRRLPLGLLMLSRGQVSHEQLQLALEVQRAAGQGRIGEWLQQLGFSTEQQVTAALALQWACPVFSLSNAEPSCARMLPLELLQSFHMMPVHYVAATGMLYVAFSEGIDYTALYAIEQTLRCHTEPCLVGRSALEEALGKLRLQPWPAELVFDRVAGAAEMARLARGYVFRRMAEEVRMVACGDYIWVRLECRREAMNLLFRVPGESPAGPVRSAPLAPPPAAG